MASSTTSPKARGRDLLVRAASLPFGHPLRKALGLPEGFRPAWWYAGTPNLGDLLSPQLTSHAFEQPVVRVSATYHGKTLGAGSILHHARAGDVVWGSGLFRGTPFDATGVRFLAVRGPRTRSAIRGSEVPEVFGDPAVLLPQFYVPRTDGRRYDVGIVPHYVHQEHMRVRDTALCWVDVTDPNWRSTVDLIVSCDVVVSSSLHGIIVAEAYGIATVWVEPGAEIVGGRFKFDDYFEGTGRGRDPVAWGPDLRGIVDLAEPAPVLDPGPLLATARGGGS